MAAPGIRMRDARGLSGNSPRRAAFEMALDRAARLVWMAGPFLLFTVAQQWIASSLAGMINGAAPLFTAAIGAVWHGRAPRSWQLAGLRIGFAVVMAIYWPALPGLQAAAFGAELIVLATFMYGIAFNLAEPLRYLSKRLSADLMRRL